MAPQHAPALFPTLVGRPGEGGDEGALQVGQRFDPRGFLPSYTALRGGSQGQDCGQTQQRQASAGEGHTVLQRTSATNATDCLGVGADFVRV